MILVVGRTASGKSTLAKELARRLNYNYIDIDKVGHGIYKDSEVLVYITKLFGNEIFNENGDFDRKRLGKIVFSEKDSNRVKEFNDYTWALMEKAIDKELNEKTVLDWIKLPMTKYWKEKGIKILVKIDSDESRFKMIKIRDNVTDEYLKNREQAGINYNEDEFDYIFYNDYKVETLNRFMDKIIKEIEL